jgi:predicted HD superfamily hydrolase involved in NAD metabolism
MSTSETVDSTRPDLLTEVTRLVQGELSRRVSDSRRRHVERVVAAADALAERFGVPPEGVRLAAAAHDLDREISPGEARRLVKEWGIDVPPGGDDGPEFLHGPIAAERLRRQFGVTDREILHAVRHHTLGDPGFGRIGLILFVADFCEPGRRHLSDVDRSRILGKDSLEAMAREVLYLAMRRFGPLEEGGAQLLRRLDGIRPEGESG